jgi:hypothetical protein
LLARFFSEQNPPWLLKGGYAMELRIRTARTTKDVDLSLPADSAPGRKGRILELLQSSAAEDLNDFFVFTIGQQLMGLDAAPDGGARYPVTASLAEFSQSSISMSELVTRQFSPRNRWKEGTGWVSLESIRQNLWRFPRNSSLQKNCTSTHSRAFKEPIAASKTWSIWRFCSGSRLWIKNGSRMRYGQLFF